MSLAVDILYLKLENIAHWILNLKIPIFRDFCDVSTCTLSQPSANIENSHIILNTENCELRRITIAVATPKKFDFAF